uniref:hypothetical protein n=1 Tax=Thaumasiovibrio occultus TaxID=1891184 RepID=UPI000B35D755|nr:hypothetical protein [Thaumasiovibrio occultus]
MKLKSLLAATLLTTLSAPSLAASSCVGSYVDPVVIDAMRSHTGVIEVPVNIAGGVTIVLMDDAIVDLHESGIGLNWDVSEDDRTVVVKQNRPSDNKSGTSEFNVETARGRMHTIHLIYGEHAATTHKVVIEG